MTRSDGVDAREAARRLGISVEAAELHYGADVIDLHVDSFIWYRLFGYDFRRRHQPLIPGFLFGQFDLPRARDAGVSGATFVITTNPLASARDREQAFFENLRELTALLESPEAGARVVASVAEYRAARAAGRHAAFLGVQGGNAFGRVSAVDRILRGPVIRVTLLHLTRSAVGGSSAPLGGQRAGLAPHGRELVERLNHGRILVDLAHISERAFWQAVDVHDRSLPFVVTHTGVSGQHRHWRNVDDRQLRAVAASGGTVGIMYHSSFLGDALLGGKLASVVRHLEHVVATIGEDFASLGSDWDGNIVTPRDMPSVSELPRLTDALLRRGWSERAIRKVLGENWLRVVASVRGE